MLVALIAECAREKAGLGSEYHMASWEDFTSQGLAAQKFGFWIAPLIQRGKRKGRPNWKKSTDERVVWVSDAELKAWVPKWVERTGKCSECMGDGKVMLRWNHETGTEYKPCMVCTGTGRFNGAEPATTEVSDSEHTKELAGNSASR